MKIISLSLFFIIAFISQVKAQYNKTTWGNAKNKANPWVENISRPTKASSGLEGRHIAVWASHGRFYDAKKQQWRWQRPNLFGTTEDLFTQTIVVPYLIPMLENAGAIVVTPRERDWQKHEEIVDNDLKNKNYLEFNDKKEWRTTAQAGFSYHAYPYNNLENPFFSGTARQAETRKKKRLSYISYQPEFKESGKYAVYVSYVTTSNSVDDAEYIVLHKGQETRFLVNQKIGGGTWVYLGTFEFDQGNTPYNRVILTNKSKHKGVVTADAVRFGGGMGNIVRGTSVSRLPRALEGARYYTQWAGAPSDIVSKSNSSNDYTDDINCRSLFINWLAGGSSYVPNKAGKGVPIELSLAVHSDAGVNSNGTVGTLGICTTQSGNQLLDAGLTRDVSKQFAQAAVDNIKRDIEAAFKVNWNSRSVKDQNYSETRIPAVPSIIIETLSHQNFNDMRLGHDPNFKFIMARSLYKTILNFSAKLNNEAAVVQPLRPTNFRIEFISKRTVRLSWTPVRDALEKTAIPTSYNVYTAMGTSDFDNGVNVRKSHIDIDLEPGLVYSFKVTAHNKGGESFPTEVLSAVTRENARQTILVVNGFHRLASPAVVNTGSEQGFDFEKDPGVCYGKTAGWNGKQIIFDKTKAGREGPTALGYCGDELAGQFIVGNEFNYVRTHVDAINSAKLYNVVSCSSEAIEQGLVKLKKYALIDLALGLEKDDGYSLYYYKAIKPRTKQLLTEYLNNKGRIFINGAYFASDLSKGDDANWLANYLKVGYEGTNTNNHNPYLRGMNMSFDTYRKINEQHYAAHNPDILRPMDSAFSFMTYDDGTCAGVAYSNHQYKTIALAMPFECIRSNSVKGKIMRGILKFLLAP